MDRSGPARGRDAAGEVRPAVRHSAGKHSSRMRSPHHRAHRGDRGPGQGKDESPPEPSFRSRGGLGAALCEIS